MDALQQRGTVPKLVTAATFQLPMFWLNFVEPLLSPRNMDPSDVALATFHEPMFWLKATALLNALSMFITRATFQLPMLALKTDAV